MANKNTVRLALAKEHWMMEHFDPSIEGIDPITHDPKGTPVPADKEEEVRHKAKEQGVSLRKVKEDS